MKVFLYSDGGARGNPGPAAAGIIIKGEDGEVIKKIGRKLGIGTNNEAEYRALILGLMAVASLSADSVECYLDSELVVRQMTGAYKVKNDRLRLLYQKVKEIECKIAKVTYSHVSRNENSEADAVVNAVLDGAYKSS